MVEDRRDNTIELLGTEEREGDGSPAGFQLIRNKTANLRPLRKATDAAFLRRSVAAVSQVAIDRASRTG